MDYKNFERFINLAFSGRIDYEKIKDYKMPDNFTHQEQVNFLNIFLEDKEKIHINENGTEIFPLSHKSAYIDLFKKEARKVRIEKKYQVKYIESDKIKDSKLKEQIKKNREYFQSEKGRKEFYELFKDLEGMNLSKYKDLGLTDNDKNNKQSSASGINQEDSSGSNNNQQSSSTSNINQEDSAGSNINNTKDLNPNKSKGVDHKNNNKIKDLTKKHSNKKFLYSILSACIVNIFIFVYSKEILNKIGNLTQSNSFIDFTKNNQIISIFCLCATVILAEIIIGISCKKGFELMKTEENNTNKGSQSHTNS